jgi:pimeloyl-[acyl-carrier protein] methyl ester esterase
MADLRSALTEVDLPVLVQHGELDRITLPGAADYLAARLPAGELQRLPGVGHAPFLSRPQEVCRRWREFLS